MRFSAAIHGAAATCGTAICVAAFIASSAGCYRIAGKAYDDVDTVSVRVFVNKTLYRDVDFQLTDALRREVSALTYYSVGTPDDADAVLEGEVTEYQEPAEVIDENQEVTSRRIHLAASYKLIDSASGDVLAGPKTARWSELYRVRSGLSLAEVREKAVRKLAQKIVQDVFQPWPEKDQGQLSIEKQE